MMAALPTGVVVSALIRRVCDAGGFAAVLAKGDAQAGAVLIVVMDGDAPPRLLERGIGPDGRTALIDSTPVEDLDGYWARRRSRDPDLWVVELSIPSAERFVAETMLAD